MNKAINRHCERIIEGLIFKGVLFKKGSRYIVAGHLLTSQNCSDEAKGVCHAACHGAEQLICGV